MTAAESGKRVRHAKGYGFRVLTPDAHGKLKQEMYQLYFQESHPV